MTPATVLRSRRNAAQRHALARLQREIRATDSHTRRKYVRDFHSAFCSYESVLEPAKLAAACAACDVLLIGDYHALWRSQEFAAEMVAQLARRRPVVLGLEPIFARHQAILDEWARGEIDQQGLRSRIRFDLDWGYDWAPFGRLLEIAHAHSVPIYGLDCMPRNDLRRIGVRDRHAADKIAEIRQLHPEALAVVLIGESHLSPAHLPSLLRQRRPQDRLLTVLQNVDALYWLAAGEHAPVEAVRVSDDVVCVFNSTPLEKYESYRLYIDRWRQDRAGAPDLAPAFYNMADALLRFLNVDNYSPSTGTQPRFLVDQLPEIYYRPSEERVRRMLLKAGETDVKTVLERLETQGCCYLPQVRALLMNELQLQHGAEEAARFVHHACRGFPAVAEGDSPANGGNGCSSPEDAFYTRVLEHALAYFGSRALCPARAGVCTGDFFALHSRARTLAGELGFESHREFLQALDFLVLHKDYEANLRDYRERPPLLAQAMGWQGPKFRYATGQLGYVLGGELYDAYISGRLSKRSLRSLFLRRLDKPGTARTVYFATQQKLRRPTRFG